MSARSHIWLTMSAPLLILLSLSSCLQRQGNDRLQALPALLVGSGLAISSGVRRQRRHYLLQALYKQDPKVTG